MSKVPSEAQRRTLKAVGRGEVQKYYPWGGGAPRWTYSHELGLRQDVVTRCVDAGWARVGPRRNTLYAWVELTEAGRKVL